MPELVSVIVPIYNNEKTLKRCIESICNQKYSNIEIILINDGSVDNSIEICKKYEEKDDRVHLYSQKNQGVSSARNLGISNSNGKYIFFIDADDTIEFETIEMLIKVTKKNNNDKILVGTNFKIISKNKYKLCNYGNVVYNKEEIIKGFLQGNIYGVIWNYLFARDIIMNIKFDTNTSYLEDTIFFINYINKIEKVQYTESNNSYYNYYNNLESITNNSEKVFKNIYDFIYSLDEIDKITNGNYKNEIKRKKIKLIEKEARNIGSKEGYYKFLNDKKIKEIIEEGNGYYTRLYKKNNPKKMVRYYKIRKTIKNIKNVFVQ